MLQKYFKKSTKALEVGGGERTGLAMSLKVTNTEVSGEKDMGL